MPVWDRAVGSRIQEFERTTALEAVPGDRELSEAAALLKNEHHLGLADAFAAALAKSKKAELVTADHEIKALEKEIKINWLKQFLPLCFERGNVFSRQKAQRP